MSPSLNIKEKRNRLVYRQLLTLLNTPYMIIGHIWVVGNYFADKVSSLPHYSVYGEEATGFNPWLVNYQCCINPLMMNLLSSEGPDLKPQQTAPFSSSTLLSQYTELPWAHLARDVEGGMGKIHSLKRTYRGWIIEASSPMRYPPTTWGVRPWIRKYCPLLCTVGRQCLISAEAHRYTIMDEMKRKPPLKEKQVSSGVDTLSQSLNPVSYCLTSTEQQHDFPICRAKQTNKQRTNTHPLKKVAASPLRAQLAGAFQFPHPQPQTMQFTRFKRRSKPAQCYKGWCGVAVIKAQKKS